MKTLLTICLLGVATPAFAHHHVSTCQKPEPSVSATLKGSVVDSKGCRFWHGKWWKPGEGGCWFWNGSKWLWACSYKP